MSVYFWNDGSGPKLLFRDMGDGLGPKLAKDPACCCGVGGCCATLPATLYVHVNWCGKSTITLTEQSGSCGTADRWWTGQGVFGSGPGVAKFCLWCESSEGGDAIYVEWDACAGFDPCDNCYSVHQFPCSLPITGRDAPPGGCGSCTDPYDLTISDDPVSPY